MSFSGNVKQEILTNFSKEKKNKYIDAEKFGELLVDASSRASLEEDYKDYLDIAKLDEKSIKSVLKGAFLGSGCIVDPNLDYHFEIITKTKSCAEYLFNLLSLLDFTPKVIKRKKFNTYTVYFKEAEQISIFLSLLEANSSMLEFEQIRVEKDVKNNINRNINCETANLSKTITTAIKQLNAINKLKKNGKFIKLNDKLKYTAYLREKYKEESLDFISSKTTGDDKISKSGLKHRLDKLIELANEI